MVVYILIEDHSTISKQTYLFDVILTLHRR